MVQGSLGNLGGTLMYDNLPLCTFKFRNSNLQKDSVEVKDGNDILPPTLIDINKQFYWELFFEEQIVPRNRYKLMEDLAKETPIRAYIPEQLLRWCYCRNVANHWWVQVDDDLSCWEDWQLPEVKKHFNLT